MGPEPNNQEKEAFIVKRNDLIHMVKRTNCTRIYSFCNNCYKIDKGSHNIQDVTCERCIDAYNRFHRGKIT
jgi:hypothetical protein